MNHSIILIYNRLNIFLSFNFILIILLMSCKDLKKKENINPIDSGDRVEKDDKSTKVDKVNNTGTSNVSVTSEASDTSKVSVTSETTDAETTDAETTDAETTDAETTDATPASEATDTETTDATPPTAPTDTQDNPLPLSNAQKGFGAFIEGAAVDKNGYFYAVNYCGKDAPGCTDRNTIGRVNPFIKDENHELFYTGAIPENFFEGATEIKGKPPLFNGITFDVNNYMYIADTTIIVCYQNPNC